MTRKVEYTFKIEGLTPAEMPFARLVEYYAQLKSLLGVGDNVHLVEIKEGSHASCLAVDQPFEAKLLKRIAAVKSGNAPKAVRAAQDTINAMLREDGTNGSFFGPGNSNVIEFPGGKLKEKNLYQIRDVGSFVGELYHIAGSGDEVNVRVRTDAYGVVFAKTSRDRGRALRDFLFEDLKVTGRGIWSRSVSGEWTVDDFQIIDFAPVQRETLRAAVDRLRNMKIEWPEDPVGEIDRFNKADGAIH